MTRAGLATILALGCGLPSTALSHSAGLGTAMVQRGSDGGFDVRVRLPIGAAPLNVRGPGCGLKVGLGERVGDAVETRVHASCPESATLWLEVGRHSIFARWFGGEPRVLDEVGGWVEVPLNRPQNTGHFMRWLTEGVLHILGGVDHLLFLLGLCLLGTRKRLFAQVTAFTLAHTVSLALAAFEWVRLPAAPVEACIALSIAWVGWAAANVNRSVVARPNQLSVIFAFGLLHGLGFASALDAAGLPGGALVQALVGFNLGVEAGQLLVLLGWVVLVERLERSRLPLQAGASWALGAVGVAWTLERIVGFWRPI